MEWLGRAPEEEDWPACILRWLPTLRGNELKPPAQAKLVSAQPVAPGAALLRRADDERDCWLRAAREERLPRSLLSSASMFKRSWPCVTASRSSGLPLAAKGRTARAAAALRCNAKPREQPFELELTVTEASFRIRIPRGLTFDMSGSYRRRGT